MEFDTWNFTLAETFLNIFETIRNKSNRKYGL